MGLCLPGGEVSETNWVRYYQFKHYHVYEVRIVVQGYMTMTLEKDRHLNIKVWLAVGNESQTMCLFVQVQMLHMTRSPH